MFYPFASHLFTIFSVLFDTCLICSVDVKSSPSVAFLPLVTIVGHAVYFDRFTFVTRLCLIAVATREHAVVNRSVVPVLACSPI